MKTILSILIASFALITLTAQTIYQEGLAREINSNKRPLGGVSIKFENAPSQVSDDDGKFRLAFKNKKIGDLIFLEEIKKSGYELVNRKDFEVTKISNINQLGVDVILAATGYVDAAKKEYYEVSDKALLAGFEKEKKALRQQLNATKLNQEEYLNQLQSLQEQYDIQRENLDALANKFARINFDDVSPIYEEALELFKAGKIDQAIQTLENTNPGARTNQIIQEEKRIAIAQKDLDQQKVKLAADKKKQIATVRLLADMYSVQFSPAKAEQQYDDLLQLDSTDLEILREAANFYREQHRYTKALNLYPKIIAHPQAESWQVANAHSGIGNLHTTTGNLNSALKAYTQFYNYYESFLKKDSFNTFYLNNLAISYSKLGETHTALGNLEKAVKFYEKDLELTKQLFEEYPNNVSFKNGLAISYSKLGETHTALGNLDRALNYFEQRYELGKQLFEAYPNNVSFKNGLAISYSKLGST
ncbi:MAG: tetratricopeptide repeat protein, partial [Bacteroidota bacterium]